MNDFFLRITHYFAQALYLDRVLNDLLNKLAIRLKFNRSVRLILNTSLKGTFKKLSILLEPYYANSYMNNIYK